MDSEPYAYEDDRAHEDYVPAQLPATPVGYFRLPDGETVKEDDLVAYYPGSSMWIEAVTSVGRKVGHVAEKSPLLRPCTVYACRKVTQSKVEEGLRVEVASLVMALTEAKEKVKELKAENAELQEQVKGLEHRARGWQELAEDYQRKLHTSEVELIEMRKERDLGKVHMYMYLGVKPV